jgi:hypothetical protein
MLGIRRADVAAAATGGGMHSKQQKNTPLPAKPAQSPQPAENNIFHHKNKMHKTQFKWEA